MRCYRPLVIGRRGAVAANHPLAAQAGLLALRAGGNAVDAAVATALALAVVEPMMSGLGGDGFYHVFDAASGRAVVFNGTGPAPAAATPERYAGGIPRTGPMSVSVPGMLAGLGLMHRQFGRLPWHDLFAEAIPHARDGFGATRAYCHFADEYRATLLADPRSAAVFLADGRAPALGAPIVQPDLARTLEEIAGEGAECLYRGRLARRLAAGLDAAGALVGRSRSRRIRRRGAGADRDRLSRLHRARSAAQFDRVRAAPGAEDRREFRSRRDGVAVGRFGPCHGRGQKARLCRPRALGADPRTLEAPLERLLSADYAARLAARIDMRRAAPTGFARTRPATRPISAPPTATATRSPASRASTAALARG